MASVVVSTAGFKWLATADKHTTDERTKVMSETGIVVFNGDNRLHVTKTSTSGAVTTGYVSKKDYGTRHNLKGSALTKAHTKYRVDRGLDANRNLASMLAGGLIVAEKQVMKANGEGFKVDFTFAKELDVQPVVDPVKVAGQLNVEQLKAILAEKEQASSKKAEEQTVADKDQQEQPQEAGAVSGQ